MPQRIAPSELKAQEVRTLFAGQTEGQSDVLKQLILEMYVGGLSQRDIEYSLEQALGQFVLGKRTVSELTEDLAEEYEAFRTRDLSAEAVTYLFIDTVYEPLRR